ncbi:MAG: type II 3-dehydroquinate dehydratase [Candidatus Neomarinimicrobiota bacterium]
MPERILLLYGPNLNLLGLVSKRTDTRMTLDKLNRHLRKEAAALGVELRIHQFQSQSEASRLLQRQRTRAQGILLVPGVWAHTGQLLRETLEITGLAVAVFHLEPEPGPWKVGSASVFQEFAALEDRGTAPDQLADFLRRFVAHLAA